MREEKNYEVCLLETYVYMYVYMNAYMYLKWY